MLIFIIKSYLICDTVIQYNIKNLLLLILKKSNTLRYKQANF